MCSCCSFEELSDEITELAAHISAATARWLELIAELDEHGGWVAAGAKSLAHWISYACSMSPVAAREHVRVARRLRDLPRIAASFARGELSYSKVRALTRVEEVADEDSLVALARAASAAQLERIVRGYRSCVAVEQDAEAQFAERELHWRWDEHGALVVRGRLPAEAGALLVRAIEAARDELGAPPSVDRSASAEATQTGDRVASRNVDALLALAESSLANGKRSRNADRYQIVLHVDVAALSEHDTERREAARCELEEGIPLPVEAARRLSCDGSIVRILERDGRPLSAGRKTRTISPALRRTLRSRDDGCAFPGCSQVHHVDAHHIDHWADGGRTELTNLVQLCRHHHRLLHEGGFSVRRTRTGFVFFDADGVALPHSPRAPRGDCTALTRHNAARGAHPSARSLWPRDTLYFDLGSSVDAVLKAVCPQREYGRP